MHAELAKLAHLQELHQQATALKTQIAGYAGRVSARETAVANTGRQLEEIKSALAKEATARRRMESDTDDLRLKSSRYRAQLDDAQSDTQAKALEHQIAFCKHEIDRIEDAEFASLVETETLETRQRALHETLVGEKQSLENEKTAAQIGRARDEARLAEMSQERQTLRAEIDAALLAQYDRISASGKLAVAHVEQQRCSACQMVVRPQRWNEIREGTVHFCESCGRFLVYIPTVDLTDAAHLPSAPKKPSGPAKSSAPAPSTATGSGPSAREE